MSLPTRLRSADFPYNPDHRFEKRTCNSICHSPDQEKQKRLPVKQYSLSHIQPGYYRTRELFQERTVLLQILLPVYSSDSQWLSIVLRFCSKTEISLSEGHSSFSITASESVDLHNTARAGGNVFCILHPRHVRKISRSKGQFNGKLLPFSANFNVVYSMGQRIPCSRGIK